MPDSATPPDFAIPLTPWAEDAVRQFEGLTGATALREISGATLLGERAALGQYRISREVSSGPGSSRLYRTRDARWFALTIPRPGDRAYLPALFGDEDFDIDDPQAIARACAQHDCDHLLDTGRALGLPVAAVDEIPASPALQVLTTGPERRRAPGERPLVLDLSAIWAGPLAGHLFWLAGADVVKVESRSRPDEVRDFDPGLFALVNQGKHAIALDLKNESERAALVDLIHRADVVIESSRLRALRQLGIDGDALVRETPGLVWLTISGHGASGEAANWAGIGHDCGVAGGLSQALAEVTGEPGYVGDAMPDPLTGIFAALEGWRAWQAGRACRLGFALSGVAALALEEERRVRPERLTADLRAWAAAVGQPFPPIAMRPLTGEVRSFAADTAQWLKC